MGTEEKGMTAVVKGSHMSLVDASHTTCVTDLHWLPGMAFTRDGRPPTATRVSLRLHSQAQTEFARPSSVFSEDGFGWYKAFAFLYQTLCVVVQVCRFVQHVYASTVVPPVAFV